MRDHNGSDQCGVVGIWLDSACILQIEATKFDNELNIGWKRRRSKDDAKGFDLRSFKDEIVIY